MQRLLTCRYDQQTRQIVTASSAHSGQQADPSAFSMQTDGTHCVQTKAELEAAAVADEAAGKYAKCARAGSATLSSFQRSGALPRERLIGGND
jgi:hypothetical protein